jgi:hypothetical protein
MVFEIESRVTTDVLISCPVRYSLGTKFSDALPCSG